MDYKIKACVKPQVYADLIEIVESGLDFSAMKNSVVLITGAGGFIGFYLTAALLLRNDLHGDGITVQALVRNREKAEKKFGRLLDRDDLTLCVQDVTEPVKADRADFVIHAASQASTKKSGSRAVLVVSSLKVYGAVYGGREKLSEKDNGYIDFTSYKNCYAMGKRASETLASSYCKEYGLNVKLARPSYIYGASSLDDDRVWAQFIANAVRGEDILLKSNGAAKRSFCYVSDTASALLYILLNGENAFPYNISNEKSDVTIRGFAKKACEVFPEKHMKLAFQNPEDEKEPEELKTPLTQIPEILDSTKLRALGWQPRVDLAEGIKRSSYGIAFDQ